MACKYTKYMLANGSYDPTLAHQGTGVNGYIIDYVDLNQHDLYSNARLVGTVTCNHSHFASRGIFIGKKFF